MPIDWLRKPGPLSLDLSYTTLSVLLLLGYVAWTGWVLWRGRQDFLRLTRRSLIVFLILLAAIIPLHCLMAVNMGTELMLPPGPVTMRPLLSAPSLPGLALIAVIAYAFGPAPGLIAGLIGSLAWACYTPLLLTDGFALASWGYIFGYLVHQRYCGDVFDWLRSPLFAALLTSLATVLQLTLSRVLAAQPSDGLLLLDYIVILWSRELPIWLAVGGLLGLLGVVVLLLLPQWRLPVGAEKPSFYSQSLAMQFVVFVAPMVLLGVLFSVLAVTSSSVKMARNRAVEQMEQSAALVSDSLNQFYLRGGTLIQSFAAEPQFLNPDLQVQLSALDFSRNVTPFFHHILLVKSVGRDFEIVAAVPLGVDKSGLTEVELTLLEGLRKAGSGLLDTTITELPIDNVRTNKGFSVVMHVNPGGAPSSTPTGFFLLGRALINGQLDLGAARSALRGAGSEESSARSYTYNGFVVNESGLEVIGDRADQGQNQRVPLELIETKSSTLSSVAVYGEGAWQGHPVLQYVRKVESRPLWVILELPYREVLKTALDTALPMAMVQGFFGLMLVVLISLLATRITRPLNTLAQAANRIARGDLKGEIMLEGDDEVSQLGDALDQMRLRLQDRLNDLSLLLDISGKVSATLDLEQGIIPVLEGALEETSGLVARFITLRDDGRQAQVFSAGTTVGDLVQLDRALVSSVVRRKAPLVLSDLGHAYRGLRGSMRLRSVAALPVRSKGNTAAVFWVGAEHLDAFDEARVNFLTTLASQAAVLIENARLFQTAEGGRQRLAAILSSTRDPIMVVDADGNLLLTNPAAQRLFELERHMVGQSVKSLGLPETLLEALSAQTTTARRMRRYQLALPKSLRSTMSGREDTGKLSPVEVPFDDGRTFYASMAPITSDEGVMVGVVVVLRDVTHFKELNEMKSEFVATVSHDLRAPLTFMRGYATMLLMVGDLNDRQRDYLQRILDGIEQMNGLVGDLLDLRRVEAGVGIRQEPCRLGLVMVEAVEAMRARATNKGVDLRMEPSEGSPTIIGDRTLLRQAISNLVDNAVKYTPSGGEVIVGLDVTEDTTTVRVSDTGIGIAPEDQVRLFEKFYRIKRRETGSVQGTGLGLALVKSIVERHGGQVGVESALNHGSTFYIQLQLPKDNDVTFAAAAYQQPHDEDSVD